MPAPGNLISGTLANFPSALADMLQSGFLERELEEGLDSILAYRRECLEETVNCRIGETLTRTRKGRKNPVTTPLSPSAMNVGLDNGLTPSTFAIEQYSYQMYNYGDTVDVNMMQELAGIANQLIADSRNNGVQAAQSLERICRYRLFSAYMGGNSRVREDLGVSTTTTCHLDDIRGFQFVLSGGNSGALQGVSGASPLTVNEIQTSSGGVSQVLTVTGATPDSTNVSSTPDGVSGVLTFNVVTTAPFHGDAIISTNSAKIFRPSSRYSTALLTGSDVLTMGLIEDAVAYLRNQACPPMPDGTYHCILDNTSMRQLWADQDFKVLFAGRDQSPEFRDADVIKLLGVTYIPTTEAYVQPSSTNTGGSFTDTVSVTVRRPIILGAEAILQGNFEGMEEWLNREGINPIGMVYLVNHVAQILRPPLDRLQQLASLSWTWIGDFAVPTDVTATSTIIPTAANNVLYKRGAIIETAG